MTGLIRTAFLLDGGNVAAELENGRVTNNYLRGANLIRWTSGMGTGYYLYNAHGDVVNLTNPAGASYRTYSYDAFGKQKNPDSFDFNPFRYCGEYYDKESGNYYLRSRYYNPANGRFTQPDSHWNSVNRIYGDIPQKINERQDALGTTLYSYRPQISAIMQSGNLYAYALNNPISYVDPTGEIALIIITGIAGAVIGGVIGGAIAHKNDQSILKGALIGGGIGAIGGVAGGAVLAAAVTGTATASVSMVAAGVQLKIAGIATTGYSSFEAFKRVHGSAGAGKAYHHIVEQNAANVQKFGAEMIHNSANIVKIPHGAGQLHNMISGHYSSIQAFTNGMTVRAWLNTQSFDAQLAYGLKILTEYADKLGITIEYVK